jgi:hypothetical protein
MAEGKVSTRLVRSSLRYLRERVGDAAFDSILAGEQAKEMPALAWQALLLRFEQQYGDPASWTLVREMTRYTMAVAVQKGWSTFLAGATPESLLERAQTFWSMNWNAGALVVAERAPHKVVLELRDWPGDPPEIVGPIVAEGCAVFLARLGETPRAVAERQGKKVRVVVTW